MKFTALLTSLTMLGAVACCCARLFACPAFRVFAGASRRRILGHPVSLVLEGQ